MTKSDVLNHIAKTPKYIDYCKKVATNRESFEDLFQFVILELNKKSEEYLVEKFQNGELDRIYLGIVYKNYNSTSSPFFMEYGKYYKYHFTPKEQYDYTTETTTTENTYFLFKEMGFNDLFVEKESDNLILSKDIINKEIEIFRKESLKNEYVVNLFNIYLEYKTYREVQRQTGIYFVTVQKTIQKFKKEIKKRCQKYLQ